MNRYYYHKDHLGSIVGISDLSGNKVIEYDYDVFGKTYVKVGTGEYIGLDLYTGNFYNNSRVYTSREYDREIGLYFYRARYYDGNIGRFISRDPIGQVDNVNLYTYVGNNSIMFIDPSGEVKQFVKKVYNGSLEVTYYVLDKGEDALYASMIIIGEGMSKGGSMGTSYLVAGGCMVGGLVVVGGTSGVGSVAAGAGCAGGAAVGGGAGVGLVIGGETLKSLGETGKSYKESRGNGDGENASKSDHINSDFLKSQNKIKSKSGRARYDNGKSGGKKEIYEWDPSHGGEIEVYDSNGKHIGVMDPSGNRIKSSVKGRTIDL